MFVLFAKYSIDKTMHLIIVNCRRAVGFFLALKTITQRNGNGGRLDFDLDYSMTHNLFYVARILGDLPHI